MKIDAVSGTGPSNPWEVYENYRRSLLQNQAGNQQAPTLAATGTQEGAQTKRVQDTKGCETCANRRYQDGSNDPGVSFKTPTRVSADQAASMVRGHEMEHVGREQSKARQEGREVISQNVTYHTAICSECGRSYVSGGTTRTTTRGKSEEPTPAETGRKGGIDTYI